MRQGSGSVRIVRNSVIGGLALLGIAAAAGPAAAQGADIGRQVWLSQAPCADCHGWMGDGNNADPRSPRGANLHETTLTAEQIAEVVLCGLPGTGMPYFDEHAYEDTRCYGATREQMAGTTPNTGATYLTKRHATGLAAFILSEFAGKPVTKAACVSLLGPDAQRCNELPN